MAKQGMKRAEVTKSPEAKKKKKLHKNAPSVPVPELQGKAKTTKEKAKPTTES